MFLVISGTKLCLDPTYHTWLQSASIDGHFDTHKGGGLATFYFWLSLQWPQTCGGQRLGLAGYWRLGMMKIVFYRYQAIHSNVQSRRQLGRTPPCLPAAARRRWKEAVLTAAHKEDEVIASWFCFAAGHQSPSLEMVGYKQQKKLTKKILNNEGGYCTLACDPWILIVTNPANCSKIL